jgi:hypothetical protein
MVGDAKNVRKPGPQQCVPRLITKHFETFSYVNKKKILLNALDDGVLFVCVNFVMGGKGHLVKLISATYSNVTGFTDIISWYTQPRNFTEEYLKL